jgi:hypothetical protein
VVDGQQQAGQHRGDRQPGRAGPRAEFGVDQRQDARSRSAAGCSD